MKNQNIEYNQKKFNLSLVCGKKPQLNVCDVFDNN